MENRIYATRCIGEYHDTMTVTIPEWFTWALDQAPSIFEIDVDGTSIRYRAWGEKGNPLIVLVHGGGAHSGWWDHVGPHLAEHHRVVALDLAGHGDSGHQNEYSLENWADHVMAVAGAESNEKPIIVGHSMGGFVALTAAREHGDKLHGVAVIDSPVKEMSVETREWYRQQLQERPDRSYASKDDIVSRFRTIPEEPGQLPYVHRHIAEQSVKERADGWVWKFDLNVFLDSSLNPDQVAQAGCEVALIRGENGLATIDITSDVLERLGGRAPVTVILEAAHHIMLDQPVALIAVLQTLAGQWRTR